MCGEQSSVRPNTAGGHRASLIFEAIRFENDACPGPNSARSYGRSSCRSCQKLISVALVEAWAASQPAVSCRERIGSVGSSSSLLNRDRYQLKRERSRFYAPRIRVERRAVSAQRSVAEGRGCPGFATDVEGVEADCPSPPAEPREAVSREMRQFNGSGTGAGPGTLCSRGSATGEESRWRQIVLRTTK